MSRAPWLAFAVLALAPLAAHADPNADAAASLQAQLRAWIADLAGPGIDLGSHAVEVTPVGDEFRFRLPVAGPVGRMGWRLSGDPVTAMVKPLDGGSWAIESVLLPTPLRADLRPVPGGKPRSWAVTLAEQTMSGRLDPTLATDSSFAMMLRGYSSVARTGDETTQATRFDRYSWHGGWQPAGEGRVNVAAEGQGQNLSTVTGVPGRPDRVTVTAATIRNKVRVERLAFDRLGTVVRSLTALTPPAPDAAVRDPASAKERARLRELVLAVRDMLNGAEQETTLETMRFDMGGQGAALSSVTFGGRAAATDGILDVSLRLSIEGIDSPMVQQGPLRDYLPRRIALTPRVSGIPVDELVSLLLRALDGGDPDVLQAEALEVLGKSTLKARLDDVVLDLGAAVLKASANVSVATSDDIAGTAHIVATGLDALIRRASSVPELASVAPFLLMLKGIGEQKGDATTWNVVYAGGQAAVNGTDLSTLLMAPAPAPERRRARKP